MKDLFCTIEFRKKGKLVWTLRCDEFSFYKIESIINFYLMREAYKK